MPLRGGQGGGDFAGHVTRHLDYITEYPCQEDDLRFLLAEARLIGELMIKAFAFSRTLTHTVAVS
jgi:hypothetical protein